MIKKIIGLHSHVSSSVASAAFLIVIAGLFSRLLGLFRDRLLASNYGAGDTLDVYYAAFRVPDLIYNLFILGALSAAFIPVFTGLVANDKKSQSWELANGILNIMLAVIILVAFIFSIFTPSIMRIITPGFEGEKFNQVVIFTRIMFLSPIFLGLSGIFGGVLTSYKRFFVYSLAPIFYNVGIIVGIIFFVKIWGSAGLAWGVVLGAILHFFSQYIAVRQLGFKHAYSFLAHFKNYEVRKVFRLMVPRTLGIAVGQVNLFIITIFASTLASGSLAIFSFAQNLQSVPLGIVGVSFAIAVFPTLSALASQKQLGDFVKTFSETFRQILFFIIPISVFIVLLRAQIVRVVLGTGKFDWEDTTLTFQCLGIFAFSLFAQCLIPLLARTFYAMHDTKTPFYVALVSEAVTILSVLLLIGKFEVLSLAIAFSSAALVQMFFLLFILRFKLDNLDDKKIISSTIKITMATLAGGIALQGFKYLTSMVVDLDTFLGVFFQFTVSAGIGTLVFIAVSHLIKLDEFISLKKSILRKIFGSKKLSLEEDAGEISGI